jgi:N-acetylmuramoyl-L-alanine amidase
MTEQRIDSKKTAALRSIIRVGCLATAVLLSPGFASAETHGLIGARAAHVASTPQGPAADITAARLESGPDTAKLTFDLSRAVETSAFVLADPDRVILDLPQVEFSLDPETGKAPAPGRHAKKAAASLVGSFRFGLLSLGRSRVVVDLQAPARIVRTSVEKDGDKVHLVVELAKTDRASFRLAAQSRTLQAAINTAPPVSPPPALNKPTIVLDPGHGGPDTGAIVNGIVEKTIALEFAQTLARKLEASGSFNVVMTRPDDVFIPLSERVRIARSANAALMISIHADTLTEAGDVSGATVYTVSDKASDAAAAKVAAKENEADATVGVDGQADAVDVSDILFDLTRQETRAYSHVFARTLVNYWKIAGRLNKNPQRAAGFRVLKAPDVPSVLLELGYLSNSNDVAALTSADWRDKATSRMAEAIESYFADRHGPEKAQAGMTIPDVALPAAHPMTQASAATAVQK